MRRLFGCPDIVSLTEKFLMARNFFRIFTENNPVMWDSKTFCIPEAKGFKAHVCYSFQYSVMKFLNINKKFMPFSSVRVIIIPDTGQIRTFCMQMFNVHSDAICYDCI